MGIRDRRQEDQRALQRAARLDAQRVKLAKDRARNDAERARQEKDRAVVEAERKRLEANRLAGRAGVKSNKRRSL
jgi:hypothetical protein